MKELQHPPAFMAYPADFAADGVVEAMTTEEVGAYWLLICKAWFENQTATIPDDDIVLARWARLTPKKWKSAKVAVLRAWKKTDDGRWIQKRLREEYEKLMEYRKLRQESGKRGAGKRWQNDGRAIAEPSSSHDVANGKPMANTIANDSSSPSSSSSNKDLKVLAAQPRSGEGSFMPSEDLKDPGKVIAWLEKHAKGFRLDAGDFDTQARVMGAAVRALEVDGEPGAVFHGIVEQKLWVNLTDDQARRGKELVAAHHGAENGNGLVTALAGVFKGTE